MALTTAQAAYLVKLKARRTLLESAYENALSAQAYNVSGHSKTNVDFKQLTDALEKLDSQIERLENNDGLTSVRPSFSPATSGQ